MKRTFAFLLTVAMLLSLSVTAFAEGEGTAGSTIKVINQSSGSLITDAANGQPAIIRAYETHWKADWAVEAGETAVTWSVSPDDVLSIEPVISSTVGHQTAIVHAHKNKSDATITVTHKNGMTDSISVYVDAQEVTVTYLDKKDGNTLHTIAYVSGSYPLSLPEATLDGYKFGGWHYYTIAGKERFLNSSTQLLSNLTVYPIWTPTFTVGDATYDTLNEALENAAEKTEITVPADAEAVALDDAKTLTVPAGGSVKVESKADNGSASAKELTITKPDNTSETAYLVTVGGTTSAVKSSNIDNEVVAQDGSGNTLSGKEAAAQLFDIPKVLAGISATANTAIADVDFKMKVDGSVTQKDGHDKTFEVHPYATDGNTEYEVPTDALIAQKYSVTLDLGAANAGMYARLTHYKSETNTEPLGTYLIGSDGKVTFTMDSFSPVGADVIYAEDDATFSLTVEAPETIDVDTEFEVEVKLTSTVDTNLNTMTFSYSLPDGFTEVAGSKTGCLAAAEEETGGNWIWNAGGGANIALTANTPASLGTLKAKVAQANAVYNVDKTFTFNSATLTFAGVPYKEYTANAASDTTKVTTTYAITWDYNGGKLDNADNKTDTVGVNVVPTAPVPVKPGYNLSWDKAIAKATEVTTYTAVWTLDTSGMSVKFNDYGYAYLSGEDYDQLLVLNAPALADGFAYAIEGKPMFATTNANYRALIGDSANGTVYVYIVNGNETSGTILGDSATATAPKLSVIEGTNAVLAYDGDLNRDNNVKQGDLGVLVDLFNGRAIYGRTGVVDIRARLEADMDNTANAKALFKSIADINEMIKKLFPAPASGG